MDVRQFAFLAGQPSAALKKRESFLGMPKRGLAFILANAMFWQPLWAQADGIVVSAPGTSLGQAANGVPVVNIAAPNASGLSHNQFHDYNVGTNGVILNNSTQNLQNTQLGGYIIGNSNLNGRAASTILNEVNGGSPSQLRGYTEVAGQSAHVIVANPYGISCNGCGFINTPQATLTTGKAVLTNGQVSGYQVDGGSVSIEGAGLNANNIDRFEIITRSAKLNAEIQAKNLAIIAGANDVDAKTLKATARSADPATAPQLAIDSSALGGMYAGAIKLVGTEAGVGVKLDGKMVASGGDIQLDANGHLSMVDTAATGAVTVKAQSLEAKGPVYAGTTLDVTTQGDLTSQNNLVAKDRITLSSGGQLTNNGIIEAGVNADNSRNNEADVEVTAQSFSNTGKSVIASRDLKVTTTQTLNNQGGTLSAQRQTVVTAGTLDNRNQGRVLSADSLNLSADTVLNGQGGLINSVGQLTATLGHLNNNAGEVSSKTNSTLILGTMDNLTGLVMAENTLDITASGAVNNQGGRIGSNQVLLFKGQSLDNTGKGRITAQQKLELSASHLDNSTGSLITNGPFTLTAGTVDNAQGRISSKDDLTATVTTFNQQDGALLTEGNLTLNGGSLDNSNAGLVSAKKLLVLNVDSIDNRAGEISSVQAVNLSGQKLNNSEGGKVLSDTALGLKVVQVINQSLGQLVSQGGMTLTGSTLDNSGGQLSAQSGLVITLEGALTNQLAGLISSEGTLTAHSGSLDNSGGSFSSAGLLQLTSVGALVNQGGRLVTDGGIELHSASLDNRQKGTISGLGAVSVNTGDFDNSHGGFVSSADQLDLTATQLTNQDGGRIGAAKALTASVTGLDQQGGQLNSDTSISLDLNQGQLNNQGGLINAPLLVLKNLKGVNNQGGSLLGSAIAIDFGAATGDLNNAGGHITTAGNLTIDHLRDLNNQGGELTSTQSLTLQGRTLDNSNAGKLISSNLLSLTADNLINQNGGLLSGWEGVTVNGGSLDNRNSGTVSSRSGNLALTLAGALLNGNAGALVSQKVLTVNAASLDNSDKGIISSAQGQTLTVSGVLNNATGGSIDSGAALTLQAMALNNGGTINAQQALTYTGTTLDNSNGTFSGSTAVTLDLLGALTNSNGKLSAGGPLLIQRSTQINNQGGALSSQGLLSILTGSLDNSNRGTLAATDKLTITSTGDVQNGNAGLIASANGDVQLTAASLGNARGSLQGQGAVTLDVGGDIDSQGGKVIAQTGDLLIKAGNLDNQGGVLSSIKGNFESHVVGVLKNGYDLNRQGGLIQAQRLTLNAQGGIDNYGGRIVAQTGDVVIDAGAAGNINNRDGIIQANGLLKVSSNDFDSSGDNGGQVAAGQIDLKLNGTLSNRKGVMESDRDLSVTAASVDNQGGQLRVLGTGGKTEFQLGGLFDNRNGRLETASNDLVLNASGFQNQDGSLLHLGNGTLGISTANVLGAGGSLVTRGNLTLTADEWTNSSVIQAGKLTLNIGTLNQLAGAQLLASNSLLGTGGNWSNDGLIASDGSASLNLSGSYGGNGRYTSLGTLGLTAAQVSLGNSASIAGGAETTLNIAGQLGNSGRITSAAGMTVTAGAINNYGTLGSTGNLRLTTSSLLNDKGLIFSGGDMALRTDTFTNRYADLYSFGKLAIAKDDSNGLSSSINNISSTIESGGDLSLSATHIENRKDVFEVTGGQTSGYIGVQCYYCADSNVGRATNVDSYVVWVENYKSQITKDSASSSMTAGHNFTVNGGDLVNQASTLSAGNDLTFNLQNFINQGASVGDYSIRRAYSVPSVGGYGFDFWSQAMAYNAINDPSYDPGSLGFVGGSDPTFSRPRMHFWNSSGSESLIQVSPRSGGKNFENGIYFGTVWVSRNQIWVDFARPSYRAGVSTAAPGVIQAATPFSNVLTYTSPSTYANAVVQAGGAVNITGTKSLTNSVVREGVVIDGVASHVGSTQVGNSTATLVNINRQLPPDLAQQQVNPLTLPGFSLPTGQNGLFRLSEASSSTPADKGPQSWSLGGASLNTVQRQQTQPTSQLTSVELSDNTQTGNAGPGALVRVQGLPSTAGQSRPQKYLIETNPAFADLKQFVNSDYLLSKVGYSDQESTKRLGDGFYEQRLIQQAVVARTGQRFIDGQTSDEGLFKYLMDNAISSKQQLNLSVGVSLTSEQVAALTHDIVWMEKQVVNGEEVLVPVLYLAQANNRLSPNGALIQGADVNLIAGANLENSGTLRASNNLSMSAGNSLVNAGLAEAGNRLDALAINNVVNKAGGIIAGRDVSLTSVSGDITNERTVSTYTNTIDGYLYRTDVVDSAARIEAANDLTLSAAQDVKNVGGVLKSGGDTNIKAGRDVSIASAEQHNSTMQGRIKSNSVSQYGSDVEVGRDLKVQAGRDLAVVGSRIDAKRDISMDAVENLMVSSAADESHADYKSKKLKIQEDHVKQVMSSLTAGGDVNLNAGKDMTLVSSRINAGDEAKLVAAGELNVLAAQDSDYSLYDKKKKGSFGRLQTRHDEITRVTNVGSEISTGGDLTLKSGGDQRYQVAKLDSGKDLTIDSGGGITFEGVKDLVQESHEKTNNNAFWNSSKGRGNTDETLRQTQMTAAGNITIKAVEGLKVDIKQVNQESVSQAIDAMVKADPQLAWLKDAESRGDVDWHLVKEIHSSYKYSNSGLGPASQLIIAIVMAAVVGPMAMTAMAGSSPAIAFGVAAIASNAATNATTSFINNGGNLGAVFKDLSSPDAMKGYAISGITAGLASGYYQSWTGATANMPLNSWANVGRFAANQALQSSTSALLGKALGNDANVSDALKGALFNTLAAVSFSAVGDYTLGKYAEGSPQKVIIHAMVGGLLAEATGGDFKTGALAAGVNELLIDHLSALVHGDKGLLTMSSQIVGVLAAAAQSDTDASKMEKGSWVASYASQYNRQLHADEDKWIREHAKEFAASQGISEQQATERLAQQALKNVDYLWRALLSDGNDDTAASFLASSGKTFTNDLGEQQALFTAKGQQLFRPEMFADTADPKFYRQFVQSGISRPLSEGLLKEMKDSGLDLKNGAVDLGRFVVDHPGAALEGLWEGLKDLPGGVVDGFKESGQSIGEGAATALNDDLTAKLNAIYGVDVSTAQKTMLLLRTVSAVTSASGVAKGSVKITEKVSEAIGKKLDDILKGANERKLIADGKSSPEPTGRPCCFAAGTMVSTPSGDRAIETLKVGDVVWSKPDKGGKPFAAAILATHYRNDQPIYRLKLENVGANGAAETETLLVTPSHPFYVPERRDFIPAIDLKPGDLLQSLSDGEGEKASTRVESLELFLPVGETYNLTVDIGHTFYVGKLKTWVHNTGTNAPCSIDGRPVAGSESGAKATLPVETDLGKVSFDAANGVGTIYSPKVTMNAGEVIFDDFAIGTSKGFIGYGPDGASELVGPLKKLLEYTQSQGAKTVTLKGYYASEEGAALGAGKVGEKFSFSFPATKEGLRDFLKGLK
ncbi:filamentous hemagglutinin [Pseudomonas asplenii]|uniref:Filamentous hemagglutinin n=1 Tax=Pseudomonas asplenii TaxID=53407 RepID=A0A1H1VKA3_9PSED|nr:filamentous hemagglutinin N-terminal domain-containing protein [Pseudomonas asplenii]SDS84781.1 filamentous hemagglutinin [Pseudomonas asplenii]